MNNPDHLPKDAAANQDRLLGLSEASLRIAEKLDPDAVLQETLDSARSLTNARYGGITTFDKEGQLLDFITSGFTAEEERRLMGLPQGLALYDYFKSLESSLRFGDVADHMRSLGFAEDDLPLKTLLGAPMRYQGEHVGNLYVADKEGGGEFTPDDEETLVLFAVQAALADVNARKHRDEQRARADLETLIDISPVGVVVFDAKTGAPVLFNREVQRIADRLRLPEQPLEQLLEVVTIRRADGQEVSMAETPLAQVLNAGEEVRVEEIVMAVPDGGSITTLLNGTPVYSEEGDVVSYMATIQDTTPLEDLERLRADFLVMVSRELRTPLSAVKGSVATLLDQSSSLTPAETHQFHQIIDQQTDRIRRLIRDLLDVARIETGSLPLDLQPVDLAVLVGQARDVFESGGGRHSVNSSLPADLPWVMADRVRILQVLASLLSSAAHHLPESSPINVSAARDGTYVAVSVADEEHAALGEHPPRLLRRFPRTNGKERGSGIAGSGLDLAICRGIVEAHGGRIWTQSEGAEQQARITFTVPAAEEIPSALAPRPGPSDADAELGDETSILVMASDPLELRELRDALAETGYRPVATSDPEEVLRLMAAETPRLALLDLMLPNADGIALMHDILAIADVPVILLSARTTDEIIARAFDAGADDYLVKPFSSTEMAARIRTALRRRDTSTPPAPYKLGDLVLDHARRQVTLAGTPVPLTAIEYRMLAELAANPGQVLTYQRLLNRVWGPDNTGDVRPMRTVVSALRLKLGDDADQPTYIHTEPRMGYRMAEPEAPEQGEG